MKKRILYLVFLFNSLAAWQQNVHAQAGNFIFDNLTHENGLACQNVGAICKDAQGFIWIGSSDGLTKYDGHIFKLYTHESNNPHSISDPNVNTIFLDHSGILWIGTRNGLNRYNTSKDNFDNFLHDSLQKSTISNSEVWSITEDKNFNLWIATDNGLNMLDAKIKREASPGFSYYQTGISTNTGLCSNMIFSVCFDNNNVGWVGTDRGLNYFTFDKKSRLIFHSFKHDDKNINTPASDIAWRIIKDSANNLWLISLKGMLDRMHYFFPQKTYFIDHILPELNSAGMNILMPWSFAIKQNTCWLGTGNGLVKFKFENNTGGNLQIINAEKFINQIDDLNSLVNNNVYSLFADNSGIIWAGTANGVSKYIEARNKFHIRKTDIAATHAAKAVYAMAMDKQQNLFAAGNWNGITITRNDNDINETYLKQTDETNCLLSSSNILYAGCNNGLYKISEQQLTQQSSLAIADFKKVVVQPALNLIISLGENKHREILAGTGNGLYAYLPVSNTVKTIATGASHNSKIIRTIFCDERGMQWIGTDEGLFKLNENDSVLIHYTTETSPALIHNRINSICKDKQGNLWLATANGLDKLDIIKNTITYCKTISEWQDNQDNIDTDNQVAHISYFSNITIAEWNGQSQGEKDLTSFALTEKDIPDNFINAVTADANGNIWTSTNDGIIKYDIEKKRFGKYSVADGLPSDLYEPGAMLKDDAGNIYFGNSNGYVFFDPLQVELNKFSAPAEIADISIMNKSVFKDLPALLKNYTEKHTIDLPYNQNFITIKFRALNFDEPEKTCFAYFLEGLDYGWHLTNAQFVSYNGISPGHYTLHVKAANKDGVWNNKEILLPVNIAAPWWKTWWFYLLCTLFVCTLLYSFYKIKIDELKRLTALRSKISGDLHDDMGSTLSSINMLSRLAKIKIDNQKETTVELLDKISKSSEQMMENMSDIVWSINPENDLLQNMLVRMKEFAADTLETKNININFDADEALLKTKLPLNLRKDFYLIYKEAINNAAKYADCSLVIVKLFTENNCLTLIINDNGKGFDTSKNYSGNGLKNYAKRAATIGGTIQLASLPGTGTTVTLTIPGK